MGFENEIFGCQGIFYINFDYKNGCKNEFKKFNVKSCSWSRKSFYHKIDFKAQWLRSGHADSGCYEKDPHIIFDSRKFLEELF